MCHHHSLFVLTSFPRLCACKTKTVLELMPLVTFWILDFLEQSQASRLDRPDAGENPWLNSRALA